MSQATPPSKSSTKLRMKKPVGGDSRGQVSFAVVAVLLLTLAGASAVLASQANLRQDDSASRRANVEEMVRYFSLISPQVEEAAYRSGIAACEELRTLNETILEARFQELLDLELADGYPCYKGGLKGEILNRSLHLDFLRLAQGKDDALDSKEGIRWYLECSPAYFTIVGNFSVMVSKGHDHLICAHSVERNIYIPSPLLLDRLAAFERSVTGGKNRLENLVRYELSSLAQWRALSGWGSNTPWGQVDTSSLLSENDVRRAMGLGLLMVELECFGSFDLGSASEILGEFPSPIDAEKLSDMLQNQDRFDPADIFLRLNGVEELDLSRVLAQALYSTIDVLALRWLDYLHVIELGQAVEGMSVGSLVAINDLLEEITGEDNLQQASMQWMKERLDESGNLEANYRWMNYGSQDTEAFIPYQDFEFRNYQGEEFVVDLGGRQALDFPSCDVLDQDAWKDFLVEYRQGTFRFGDILQTFIASICYSIAEDWDIPSRKMILDPFDGVSMIDEAKSAIIGELVAGDDWFAQSVETAEVEVPMKDPLGESLIEYIDQGWQRIFHMSQAVDFAIDKMALGMVRSALVSHGIVDEFLTVSYSKIVSYELKNDPSLGARQAVEEAFSIIALERVGIFTEVFGNISVQGVDGPLSEVLVVLAQGMIEGVPGVRWALIDACHNMLEDCSFASGLRADATWVEASQSNIHLILEGGLRASERLLPEVHIPWVEDHSSLQVQIESPLSSKGLHLTDPSNVSFAAYQSIFKIKVRSPLEISLGCDGELSNLLTVSSKARMSCELSIAFKTSLTCSSAWPLQGVDYSPTSTLDDEIGRSFGKLWQGMFEALKWLASAANSLFEHMQELLSDINSYAVQAVKELSDLFMAIVQEARDLIDGAIGSFIGWIGQVMENLTGSRSFKLEFAGLIFLFDFSPADIFLGHSKEYVKVTVITSLFGAQFAINARFVDIYRQGPDIIANMTLSGNDWTVECVIDPRMMVMDHFVEMRGFFKDFVLEVTLPEVVAYEKRTLRLSDIPGLGQALSRIPIPVPGLTASIDVGFEVKYDNPIATNVVINEVELNPPGLDQGREWVELYNPSNSQVDITGWTIRTAHGDQVVSPIADSAIGPKSYLVVGFPGQSLDNGGETGYPLGESMSLVNSAGKKVDSIPFISDHYNDARTWQRTFDGSDRWGFEDSTRSGPNGLLLLNYNDLEQWERTLADAVTRSFAKLGQIELDIGSLAEIIKTAVTEVVDTILQTLAHSLVEMSIFIEVALQDYTQSLAGRIRLSLVITGEGVKDALLWVAYAIRTALANIINPAAVAPRAHSIHEVLDDVYIRFGALGTAGLPKLISSTASDKRFSFGAYVELNLACLVANPNGLRNWTVNFGVLFEGVPGALLRALYPVDADQLVDVWLIKATLHSARPEDRMPPL
jgi:hypothetical protein